MIGGVLVAVGVTLVLGFWFVTPRERIGEPSPQMVTSVEPSGLPFPSVDMPPQMDVRAELRVEPEDARVWVDDEPVDVQSGRVAIEAQPGEEVTVKLASSGVQTVHQVVITATGDTYPQRVALDVP